MKYMSKKLRIAVLMGGPSAEHEVSLKSGGMVLKNLNREKYEPKPVIISKSGRWPILLSQLKKNFDLAFIIMHGEYGEDGKLQEQLENISMPYTGSDSTASKLGMDKIASALLFKATGLKTPRFVLAKKNAKNPFGYPCIVKPADRGSSVGISVVRSPRDLKKALSKANRVSRRVLIQEYIKGRELTCGVIDYRGRCQALLPTEIIPKSSEFFDYKAKYTPGASMEITPPRLSKAMIARVQQVAALAHGAIAAGGFSRTDMILSRGQLYVLEINTIPGMAPTSLLPQAAAAVGLSFSRLLDIMIESAL
jgi:D-alanine-D-alanine ligase